MGVFVPFLGTIQFDGHLVLCENSISSRYAPTIILIHVYVPVETVELYIYNHISGNTTLPIRITPAQYIDICILQRSFATWRSIITMESDTM